MAPSSDKENFEQGDIISDLWVEFWTSQFSRLCEIKTWKSPLWVIIKIRSLATRATSVTICKNNKKSDADKINRQECLQNKQIISVNLN